MSTNINPLHPEFTQWTCPTLNSELSIVIFRDISMKMFSLITLSMENGKTATKYGLPQGSKIVPKRFLQLPHSAVYPGCKLVAKLQLPPALIELIDLCVLYS